MWWRCRVRPDEATDEAIDEVVGEQALGIFRTAPDAYVAAPARLAWGADLGGQNVCRDAEKGFEIFDAIRDSVPDLFVGSGNMIYADDLCDAVGRYGNPQIPASFGKATDLDGFRAHWRYSRADPAGSAPAARLHRLLRGAGTIMRFSTTSVRCTIRATSRPIAPVNTCCRLASRRCWSRTRSAKTR